ncbi:MAG: ABC transporter ATP-binding protein [Lentisphaerae bacterium]|nr:ABC transporter ATP-binding protein [Lentisphaerota bacterium]
MKNKETVEQKQVSYWRLLKYTKPYKFRLAIGILSGLLIGGSLFGSFMMLPSLFSGIEFSTSEAEIKNEQRATEICKAVETAKTEKEKVAAVKSRLDGPKKKSKIEEEVGKVNSFLASVGVDSLRASYVGGDVVLATPEKTYLTFPAETASGKMTWQFFSLFCFGFVLLWALKNIATYINHYCMYWVGQKVVSDMREEIFSKLINQSTSFYGKMDVGQLISRCSNDLIAIESSVSHVIADATRCPIEILSCVAAVVYAGVQYGSWTLPLILFVGMPVCLVPLIILGRKIRKIYRKSYEGIAVVSSRMHEVFTGINVVKAYHAEKIEEERFNKSNRHYLRTVIRAIRAQLLMSPLMETVSVICTLAFLIYSYSQEAPLSVLAQILAPCLLAYRPIKDLAKVSTYIQRSMAAADRYFQIIDMDTSVKESPNPKPLKSFEDKISFKNVSFSYDDHKILDDVSFEIPKGSMVAVVGPTGSGKSTIANLIARFYDCTGGTIEIDGKNVKDIAIKDLRKMIGVVSQEAIIFNDTIAENIAYGTPEATREEIIAAAKQANAHEFIVDGRHPEGYETVAGEKGFRFSGGEKQRLSIARAILRNPPILILDEATSALDTVTERLVQDALNKVMAERTVFAIAHRLSTIRNADLILVINNGKIVERGTHDELIAQGGHYKRLCDIQFK